MAEAWDFISGHRAESDTIVKADGSPLTIGDVKRTIRHALMDRGLAILPGSDRRAVPGYAKLRGPGGTRVAARVVKELALTVGMARFNCPELPVLSRGPRGVFPVHGVLGADLLMRCRLTIDRGRVKVSI